MVGVLKATEASRPSEMLGRWVRLQAGTGFWWPRGVLVAFFTTGEPESELKLSVEADRTIILMNIHEC